MHGEAVAKPQKMTDHHVPERPINDDPQVTIYDSSPIPAGGKAWTSDGKKGVWKKQLIVQRFKMWQKTNKYNEKGNDSREQKKESEKKANKVSRKPVNDDTNVKN